MVLPSRRAGYGMIVVEAAACGTPSILVREPDNAAVELIALAGRVVGMGVTPDHIAHVAREDRVVAVATQQHVVDAFDPTLDAAFVARVPDVMLRHRPAGVAGHRRGRDRARQCR